MNAIFRCRVWRIIISDATGLCKYHTYTSFMDKYQEQLSTNLQAWKKSPLEVLDSKCHTDAGETERLLLKSEEALDRIILANGSEIVDKRRAYNQQEYFYINTKFRLFLAKFKALRLPKVKRLYIAKNSNDSKRIYRNYFYPMKHQLKKLMIYSNSRDSKFGWHLRLIAQNAFKAKSLFLFNWMISMAQFKKILASCNTIQHLALNNCRLDENFNSESGSWLSQKTHKGSTVSRLTLTNCDIQGKFGLRICLNPFVSLSMKIYYLSPICVFH